MNDSTEHGLKSVTLPVVGLSCGNCVRHTEEALRSTAGVKTATVTLASESAHIEYDPGSVELSTMRKAVQAAGYDLILPGNRQAKERS